MFPLDCNRRVLTFSVPVDITWMFFPGESDPILLFGPSRFPGTMASADFSQPVVAAVFFSPPVRPSRCRAHHISTGPLPYICSGPALSFRGLRPGDPVQKRSPVLSKLNFSHPGHVQEFLFVPGLFRRHIPKGGVRKHHIGGDPLPVCQLPAQGAEFLKERGLCRRRGLRRVPELLRYRARDRDPQGPH